MNIRGRNLMNSTAALALAVALLGTVPAHAGAGANIGKVAGELTGRFSKAANPTVPPKALEPKLDYTPPAPAPGGSTVWSPGKSGNHAPLESTTGTFNRNAADTPGNTSLSDTFNSQ